MLDILKQDTGVSENKKDGLNVPFLSVEKVPTLQVKDNTVDFDMDVAKVEAEKTGETDATNFDDFQKVSKESVAIKGCVSFYRKD